MDETGQKRKAARRRTLFGGVLYHSDGRSWECKVTDISKDGVKVVLDVDIQIGEKVDLRINKFDIMRSCEVMWLREGQVGLRFLVSIDPKSENMTELFRFARL